MNIISLIKNKLRFVINANVNAKADLNKDGVVKNSIGLASCGCFVIGIYKADHKDYQGLMVYSIGGSVLLGIYLCLDKIDEKKTEKIYEYEVEMAGKKHPGNASASYDGAKEDGKTPAYLVQIDRAPSSSTLNKLARSQGVELMPLAGGLLYFGDICIFFSIANKGKTILGIQLAIDIASGKSSLYHDDGTTDPIDVVYLNFEMSTSQMNKRLAPNGTDNVMSFPSNLEVRDCKGCFDNADKFLEYIASEVEKDLKDDTVYFIDTITDICPQFFNKEAAQFLNAIRSIQTHAMNDKGITITFVLIGHTHKMSSWEAIEMDSLKGGGNQSNFVDSMFAMGSTRFGISTRYIKMLKNRNAEIREKVDVIEITNKPYLHFAYKDSDYEENVLPSKPKANNSDKPCCDTPKWDGPVPLDKAREMSEFYQEGEIGHGWDATAKKFGLKHAQEAKRIVKKYRAFVSNHQ